MSSSAFLTRVQVLLFACAIYPILLATDAQAQPTFSNQGGSVLGGAEPQLTQRIIW